MIHKYIKAFTMGAGFLASSWTFAAIDVAVVNMNELYSNSIFVLKANKNLQDNVKKMEAALKVDQDKLQKQAAVYNNTKDPKKKAELAKAINQAQEQLNVLTKKYQASVSEEQNKGMQEFNKLVQIAVHKVAKDKSIHTVLNSASMVYTDNTWIDITKDVQAEMAKS